MTKSICGADCENCGFGRNSGCKGCAKTKGCPFGKQCFIAKYIQIGGEENYKIQKQQLIDEFNSLNIDGMPKIHDLYALNGSFVNLEYPTPNGFKVKLLDDNEIYLGNQVECEFNDGSIIKCFGLVAGTDFLLVSEYGANCSNPELVLYRKR
ncbi:MAG: DUF3795 domain-containing protein [Eubacteriales bacterium]|nr:DUF3795 domain-containing protein [Eubacteriales bacterium]